MVTVSMTCTGKYYAVLFDDGIPNMPPSVDGAAIGLELGKSISLQPLKD